MKAMLKILSLLAVFAVAAPHVAYGDDKPATKTEKKGKSDTKSLYAQVDSITDTLLTVKGQGDTKFVINADTKITKSRKDKTAVKVSDVKPGQWVGGSYTKGADGTNNLHSLHTDVDQSGGGAKKKKAAQ